MDQTAQRFRPAPGAATEPVIIDRKKKHQPLRLMLQMGQFLLFTDYVIWQRAIHSTNEYADIVL